MEEIFEEKLSILAEDELLLKAIRNVFYKRIREEKPKVGETNNDNTIGQQYRAYEKSNDIIDKCFIDLQTYKVIKNKKANFNKEK